MRSSWVGGWAVARFGSPPRGSDRGRASRAGPVRVVGVLLPRSGLGPSGLWAWVWPPGRRRPGGRWLVRAGGPPPGGPPSLLRAEQVAEARPRRAGPRRRRRRLALRRRLLALRRRRRPLGRRLRGLRDPGHPVVLRRA